MKYWELSRLITKVCLTAGFLFHSFAIFAQESVELSIGKPDAPVTRRVSVMSLPFVAGRRDGDLRSCSELVSY